MCALAIAAPAPRGGRPSPASSRSHQQRNPRPGCSPPPEAAPSPTPHTQPATLFYLLSAARPPSLRRPACARAPRPNHASQPSSDAPSAMVVMSSTPGLRGTRLGMHWEGGMGRGRRSRVAAPRTEKRSPGAPRLPHHPLLLRGGKGGRGDAGEGSEAGGAAPGVTLGVAGRGVSAPASKRKGVGGGREGELTRATYPAKFAEKKKTTSGGPPPPPPTPGRSPCPTPHAPSPLAATHPH